LLTNGEVVNVASGKSYCITDIGDIISNISKKKVEYNHTKPRTGDVRHTLADISLGKSLLGYEVKVDFMEGMTRTVQFLSNNCNFLDSKILSYQ